VADGKGRSLLAAEYRHVSTHKSCGVFFITPKIY
jgi:hypothetical protein